MAFTLEGTEIVSTGTSNPEFAHYADSASVTEGYIMGKAVLAICGKTFVPSKDPQSLPVCPVCKELAAALFLKVEK